MKKKSISLRTQNPTSQGGVSPNLYHLPQLVLKGLSLSKLYKERWAPSFWNVEFSQFSAAVCNLMSIFHLQNCTKDEPTPWFFRMLNSSPEISVPPHNYLVNLRSLNYEDCAALTISSPNNKCGLQFYTSFLKYQLKSKDRPVIIFSLNKTISTFKRDVREHMQSVKNRIIWGKFPHYPIYLNGLRP